MEDDCASDDAAKFYYTSLNTQLHCLLHLPLTFTFGMLGESNYTTLYFDNETEYKLYQKYVLFSLFLIVMQFRHFVSGTSIF